MSETVGARLFRLRSDASLSQRDLAAPGVSYAYISRIEAGTRTPSVKALRKLAERLGVSAEYLETGCERTLTDDLLDRLTNATGSGVSVEIGASAPGTVGLTWRYGEGARACSGVTLTDALRKAIVFQTELDSIQRERESLDAREREQLDTVAP